MSSLQAFLMFVSSLHATPTPQLFHRSPFYLGQVHPDSMFTPPSMRTGRAPPHLIFTVLSISSPCIGWVPPNPTLTPLSMHGSSYAQLDFHSPICFHYVHKLGSPQPNFRSLIRLLPMHGLGSSRLNSCGPLCVAGIWAWSSNICENLLQVSKGQF
jgi:hypothetical protein